VNAPEVVVAGALAKLGDVSVAVSPRFFRYGLRRSGNYDFLRDQARINRERSAS
jgi:hypothetical protein